MRPELDSPLGAICIAATIAISIIVIMILTANWNVIV
jgi:hypothetical protein